MTDLLIASAVVIAAMIATLVALRQPLVSLLTELCVLEHRARFWWRVCATELVVGTALCASAALALDDSPAMGRWTAIAVVRGGCAGLLLSLVAITAGTLAIGRAE